ncbi:MAG: FHA domain-containing protein, partial [Polyangiaceae bacterium]|nr:FHA domain-containing protein [Polyangiaceae bacterium]
MATFELSAIRGPLVGRVFAVDESGVWFGRVPDAPVPIASHLASRRHAEVRVEGGALVLRDLGSANGTRLNGERVQARALGVGDVIEIGDEAFRVGSTDAPTLPQRGALVAVRGPLAGRSFPLEDRTLTLGRALDSTIVLHSQRASRRHAEVRSEPRGACL